MVNKKKLNKSKIVTLSIFAFITLAIAAYIMYSFLLPLLFYPKSHAGQAKIDKQIASANLSSVMSATYSCTGSLPLVEDVCSFRAYITTDDLGVFRNALSVAEQMPDFAGVQLKYKNITYTSAATNSDSEIIEFYKWASTQKDLKNVKVSFSGKKRIVLDIDSSYSFNEVCKTTKNLLSEGYEDVVMSPSSNTTENPASWIITGATKANTGTTFTDTCSVISDFLNSPDSKDAQANFQVAGTGFSGSSTRVYVSDVKGINSSYDKNAVTNWFSEHALPDSVILDIY